MEKKKEFLCNAQVMKEGTWAYLKFLIPDDEYSLTLMKYKGGEFVKVYIEPQ